MTAQVFAATTTGFDGSLITVECDSSNGLPAMIIVGLGNKAVDEAKERVRSSIKNTSLEFPRKRITFNLAPASLPKNGAHFDLPLAIALLVVSGQVTQESVSDTLFVGELALDGSLRPIRGVISYAQVALQNGLRRIIVPQANASQAQLVSGVEVLPAASLRDIYLHLTSQTPLVAATAEVRETAPKTQSVQLDDIRGQEQAKRALLVAAAGRHNILFNGPPGAGKTMLAKSLVSILPALSSQEIIETTKLHSLAGETFDEVITARPFRSPHHSASHVSLVGGGQIPRPGEISLAHRGVLFLDELPEYSRQALESLRQPLEDRRICIARANERVEYPADFMLVATQNPCPCGYAGDPSKTCTCGALQLAAYQKKISGPLLDRIDMVVDVSRVDPQTLLHRTGYHSSQQILQQQIVTARHNQQKRYDSLEKTNANLASKEVEALLSINKDAHSLLNQAATTLDLSARAYFKVIKVAQTIADLENAHSITSAHISEALQYRPRGQNRG